MRITPLLGALGLTVMATAVSAQDCVPAHEFTTIEPGVLTVATFEYPPFTTAGAEGALLGVEGEILKRFAERECLEIRASFVDTATIIQLIVSERADLAAGDWYRTQRRLEVLNVSAPLYLDQMGILSAEGYTTIADLEGKPTGVVGGYIWVDELQAVMGDDLKIYPSGVNMAQDLAAGRIVAATDSYATAVYAQENGSYQGVKITLAEPDDRVSSSVLPAQSGFPYTKSNTALGEALDALIVELHETGEMKAILSAHGLDPALGDVGEPRLVP